MLAATNRIRVDGEKLMQIPCLLHEKLENQCQENKMIILFFWHWLTFFSGRGYGTAATFHHQPNQFIQNNCVHMQTMNLLELVNSFTTTEN